MPGHHFVKNYAKAPDIGPPINRRAARLFRRHITHSPEYRAQIGLSQCHRFRPLRPPAREDIRSSPWRAEAVRRWLGEGGFGKLCNPEIEHLHIAVGTQHDILRFDVAMDNAGAVCGAKRARDLRGDIQCLLKRNGTLRHSLTQGGALDELGRDVMSGIGLSDLVNGDDIGMVQSRSGACFML